MVVASLSGGIPVHRAIKIMQCNRAVDQDRAISLRIDALHLTLRSRPRQAASSRRRDVRCTSCCRAEPDGRIQTRRPSTPFALLVSTSSVCRLLVWNAHERPFPRSCRKRDRTCGLYAILTRSDLFSYRSFMSRWRKLSARSTSRIASPRALKCPFPCVSPGRESFAAGPRICNSSLDRTKRGAGWSRRGTGAAEGYSSIAKPQ